MMLLLLSAGNWLCMQPLIDLCLSQFLRHHSSKQKREFCLFLTDVLMFRRRNKYVVSFFWKRMKDLCSAAEWQGGAEAGRWVLKWLWHQVHIVSLPASSFVMKMLSGITGQCFFFDSSASEEKPVWPRNMVLLLYNWLDVLTDRHHGYSNLYLDHFYSTDRRWDSADYLISPINLIIIFILFYKMWECVE